MRYYGITIKATSKINKKLGIGFLDKTLKNFCDMTGSQVFKIYYELDSKYLIHLHATIISPIFINMNHFKQKGSRIFLTVCTDIDKWLAYCQKQTIEPVISFYENNYGFVNDCHMMDMVDS